MSNHTPPFFIFQGQELYYDWEWLDGNTFNFIFGDGYFVDGDGDDYFIDVLYSVKEDKFTFTAVYKDQCITVEDALFDSEQEEVKSFIKSIVESI